MDRLRFLLRMISAETATRDLDVAAISAAVAEGQLAPEANTCAFDCGYLKGSLLTEAVDWTPEVDGQQGVPIAVVRHPY
jgi:hypothetical protein